MTTEVTKILEAMASGEELAAEQLLPLVYDELRRLAGKKMAHESLDHTLQPTALVHEAFVRLIGDNNQSTWQHRGHFYAAAAEAMRRILIESARRKASQKRGGMFQEVAFHDDLEVTLPQKPDSILELDSALEKLEKEDPDLYKLVMLRYFSGLTVEESALALDVSPRTVKRNWTFARAWLQRELDSNSKGAN